MNERRHEDHPHPPPEIPERRKCSDSECRNARDEWFTEVLLPKLMIRFWVGIGITVTAMAGLFFGMQSAALTAHELKLVALFESKDAHKEDVSRLNLKIDSDQAAITHAMNEIINRLDRNLAEIQEQKKR